MVRSNEVKSGNLNEKGQSRNLGIIQLLVSCIKKWRVLGGLIIVGANGSMKSDF